MPVFIYLRSDRLEFFVFSFPYGTTPRYFYGCGFFVLWVRFIWKLRIEYVCLSYGRNI